MSHEHRATKLPNKIRPTEMRAFLQSPRKFYWQFVRGLEPLALSVKRFDHDLQFGITWAGLVHRFFAGEPFSLNLDRAVAEWQRRSQDWVPEKHIERLTDVLRNLALDYYNEFQPDGVRIESETPLEGEVLWCTPDGVGEGRIVHEVKTASRPKSEAALLWRIQNSIQVKTQCVLAQAEGIRIELAYKDPPHVSFRAEVAPVTAGQRRRWKAELECLARYILSLGGDADRYVCSPDGCSIITKNFTSVCPYQILCEGKEELANLKYLFKEREK